MILAAFAWIVLHLLGPGAVALLPGGEIEGVVDSDGQELLEGVTVVAVSPARPGTQTAITDARGHYRFGGLPAGDYTVTFYYASATVRCPPRHVERMGTTVESTTITRKMVDDSALPVQTPFEDGGPIPLATPPVRCRPLPKWQ